MDNSSFGCLLIATACELENQTNCQFKFNSKVTSMIVFKLYRVDFNLKLVKKCFNSSVAVNHSVVYSIAKYFIVCFGIL